MARKYLQRDFKIIVVYVFTYEQYVKHINEIIP